MLKIELIADLKLLTDFPKFKEQIRKDVIENGVDATLEQTVTSLKQELFSILEGKVPTSEPAKDKDPLNLPQSDSELLKHFTGIDVEKLRATKDYTSAVEANVLIANDYRLRLRLPIGPDETLEEDYERATKFFNNAVIAFPDGQGKMQYYLNPGIDMRQYVKIVCSRDTGITQRTATKFEHYKNSNKMTRQGSSEIGRYSEWSLQKIGAQLVRSSFTNITSVMEHIKQGNYDQASAELGMNKNGPKVQEFKDKTEDLKKDSNLKPSTELYNKIVKMIKNLKIIKKIKKEEVTYSLLTSYTGYDDNPFFEEMDRIMGIWNITNENIWLEALVSAAERVIAEYEG